MKQAFNPFAQELIHGILSDHPEWEPYVEPYGDGDPSADEGSVKFSVPVPSQPKHRLEVILRGDTVEVCYDCGTYRARAERLFILPASEPPGELVAAVRQFVGEVWEGRVVISGTRFVERPG